MVKRSSPDAKKRRTSSSTSTMTRALRGGDGDVFLRALRGGDSNNNKEGLFMRSLRGGDGIFMRSMRDARDRSRQRSTRGGSDLLMRSMRSLSSIRPGVGNRFGKKRSDVFMRSLRDSPDLYMRSLRAGGSDIYMRSMKRSLVDGKEPTQRFVEISNMLKDNLGEDDNGDDQGDDSERYRRMARDPELSVADVFETPEDVEEKRSASYGSGRNMLTRNIKRENNMMTRVLKKRVPDGEEEEEDRGNVHPIRSSDEEEEDATSEEDASGSSEKKELKLIRMFGDEDGMDKRDGGINRRERLERLLRESSGEGGSYDWRRGWLKRSYV